MKRTTMLAALWIGLSASSGHGQVAITEFLADPDGTDRGREWIELFNYSPATVDLAGWTLADEDTDSFALPPVMLGSGGYLILVSGGIGGLDAATSKALFETEWLGGVSDPRVIGIQSVALGNNSDELVLRDGVGALIWSLAYGDDDNPAFATFLTETNSYQVKVFGSQAMPGVVRSGDDNQMAGFLGYEQNDLTTDPCAWSSDISLLAALFGDAYLNVSQPSLGSPLAGGYKVVAAGDLDGDGRVAVPDLLALLATWGACPAPPASCPADLDGDGVVGAADLLVLRDNWG